MFIGKSIEIERRAFLRRSAQLAMMGGAASYALDLAGLANITCPTLVICGEKDQDNGSARDLADLLPNAVYEEVPGGHLDSAIKPELGEGILRFLAA